MRILALGVQVYKRYLHRAGTEVCKYHLHWAIWILRVALGVHEDPPF